MLTITRERTCVCPGCGAVWMLRCDGLWENVSSWIGRRRYHDTNSGDPVLPGRDFCPSCAETSADVMDRVAFIRAEDLEHDFLEWLLRDAPQEDVKDILTTLLMHDPELMETRLQEYVYEQREGKFVDWRCGI